MKMKIVESEALCGRFPFIEQWEKGRGVMIVGSCLPRRKDEITAATNGRVNECVSSSSDWFFIPNWPLSR
jgi:hypothetical protein